ncbi:hypothetical protein E1B28_003140 [Marasmius oreades]|uniref:Transmembrane protein n=1 Tax=Marasmius oreades TaxID=181124 RepID=A0A9P7RKU3_9AGAR|nr:uncharacterized protein E1B28_003140 [Marasmius oreades]KAG7085589.1 hypothetical protein E1B28_003140 [Marasmius oreades]
MFHGPLLLPIGLVSLLIQVAFADEDSVLKNKDGKSPCDLKDAVSTCKAHPTRGLLLFPRETIPANRCTCTNVFWNIWSACLEDSNVSKGYSWDWNQTCEKNQLTVQTYTTADGVDYLKGIDIPDWAFARFPSQNKTFNLAQAIEASDASDAHQGWSTIQIVVPVVSVVVMALICGVSFFYYRSRKNRKRNGKPSSGNQSQVTLLQRITAGLRAQKVRKEKRRSSWVIDQTEAEEFELALQKSPSSTGATYGGGHVRLSSSPTSGEPSYSTLLTSTAMQKGQSEQAFPGTRLWRNFQLGRKLGRGWLLLRLPFKKTPVPVHSTSPSRRFEIDASNKSVRTLSTLENYRRAGFRTSSRLTNSESGIVSPIWDYSIQHDTIFEDDDEDDSDSLGLGLGPRGSHIADENQRLIPARNNVPATDVLVISRQLSVDSAETASHSLQVDPPSPNRSSPSTPIAPPPRKSSGRSRAGSRFVNTPPAPSYPAPLPPPSPPRSPPREQRPSIDSVMSEPPVMSAPTFLSSSADALPSLSVNMSDPTPLYTNRRPPNAVQQNRLAPTHIPNIPHQHSSSSLNRPIPPPPPPPSLRPSTSEQRLHVQRSAEQLMSAPPPSLRPSTSEQRLHVQRSVEQLMSARVTSTNSSSNSQYSILCSPPYRSTPLPEEILIARGGPALGLGGLGGQELSELADRQEMSPPYRSQSPPSVRAPASTQLNGHQTNHRQVPLASPHVQGRRELPVPPGIQSSPRPPHQRALSADKIDHNHPRSPFFVPNEVLSGRRTSSDSTSAVFRPLPSVNGNGDDLHLPGTSRGNMSSDSVLFAGSTGYDPRWYPPPSIG